MSKRHRRSEPVLTGADQAEIQGRMRQGMSRRDLIAMLMAAGATLPAATALIDATPAIAQTPRQGGRVKVAMGAVSATDTLDPAKQSYSTDYARNSMVYNGLTSLDGSLTPQPELAESFTHDKATIWTFKIRQGVTFHNGKPLTAADVVYSLARHKDKAVASRANALATQMEEITATGSHEVRIKLTAPNADLPVVLGTWHFFIVPEGTTDFTKTAIGTGPYKLKEFVPGMRTVGERNPNYWRAGRPYLDEIELIGIPDEAARMNALLSGDVQIIAGANPRSLRQLQATPGFSLFETKAGYYTDLVMRQDADPTRNPEFVMMMKHLFNREEIQKAVFRGYAVVANDQPIDPSNRYFCKDIPQRPFDMDKAKFHFQKTNLGNTAVPMYVSPAAPGSVEMGTMLQEQGQKIGLNIDLKRVPAEGYWTNYWMKQPLGFGAINPRPSADILFTLFFRSEANWNESGWKNERFDQLLLAARAESDDGKRKQMYCDMQLLVRDHCGIGIPVFITLTDAHSDKVQGLRPIPVGGLMGMAFAEHIWLAS